MTDCPNAEIRDLLPDYVHGTLDGASRARVESHVGSCADCASEVSLLRSTRRALERATPAVDVASIVRALPMPPAGAARPTPGVVPIGSARSARTRLGGWRRAATVGLVAAGVTTIAVVGGRVRGSRDGGAGAPVSTVAISSPTAVAGSAAPAGGSSSAATAPAARGGESTAASTAPRDAGLSITGGVSDLSDDALAALVGDLDKLDAAPGTEPAPLLPDMTGEGNE